MDRRVKYTKKVIRDTFISLLNKKEIGRITVSEICAIADINRATFYRYYLDVFDLLEQIQKDFINDLKEVSSLNENPTVSSFANALLLTFIENKDLVKTLFNTQNNIYFLDEVLEVAYAKCKNKWYNDNPELSDEEIEYASIFIFNGALGVVNYWVKNDFDKDINEVSKIIEELCYYGTRKFIYKK